ncbi:hypothetical protein THAOC_07137, partial [Thalassiosira oceanica]
MATLPPRQQEATSAESVLVGAESSWQPACMPGSVDHAKGTPKLMEDGKGGFSDWMLEDAMDEKDSVLFFVSICGGAWMIDEDKVNMQARDCMPMVDYITSLEPHGPDGPKWQIHNVFVPRESSRRTVTVLVMYCPDMLTRLLYVHSSPSHMFDSRTGRKAGYRLMESYMDTAMCWQFAAKSLRLLARSGSSLVLDDQLGAPIDESTVFNHSIHFVSSVLVGHGAMKHATATFINATLGEAENIFREGATAYVRGGRLDSISVLNRRKHRLEEERLARGDKKEKRKNDLKVNVRILSRLMTSTKGDYRAVTSAVDFVRNGSKGDVISTALANKRA